jgi:hypothetical protein
MASDSRYEALDEENRQDSPMKFKTAQRAALDFDRCLESFFSYYSTQNKKSSLKRITANLLLDDFYSGCLEEVLWEHPWNGTLPVQVFALPWSLVSFILINIGLISTPIMHLDTNRDCIFLHGG